MKSTRYSCQILTKLEFSRQVLENKSNKFHETASSRGRVVPNRLTDKMKLIVNFFLILRKCLRKEERFNARMQIFAKKIIYIKIEAE
jgi:hypothetical protein